MKKDNLSPAPPHTLAQDVKRHLPVVLVLVFAAFLILSLSNRFLFEKPFTYIPTGDISVTGHLSMELDSDGKCRLYVFSGVWSGSVSEAPLDAKMCADRIMKEKIQREIGQSKISSVPDGVTTIIGTADNATEGSIVWIDSNTGARTIPNVNAHSWSVELPVERVR